MTEFFRKWGLIILTKRKVRLRWTTRCETRQKWGEMLSTTFLSLCVGEIYVAMAAGRQSERTVAPVGGNITFAYESSERSQESDEPRSECRGLRRDVIWQIAEHECFRFHFQVDVRVNVRGVQGDMPEPSPDGIDVHAGAKQMGCRPPHLLFRDDCAVLE